MQQHKLSKIRDLDDDNSDSEGFGEGGKKYVYSQRIGFLTRSLIKNNIVKQNIYVILLTLEYLSMLYYMLRLADLNTFNMIFKPIEHFLDVTMITSTGVQYTTIDSNTITPE